jgi:hypothetical protein
MRRSARFHDEGYALITGAECWRSGNTRQADGQG